MPMTKNALAVLRAIETFEEGHPYGPTQREVKDLAGLKSTSMAEYALDDLESLG